jgi:peroxiredoxin
MTLLHPGDRLPALAVALPGQGTLQLPGALAGHYGVILLYRGSWCPYCNAQLRAFPARPRRPRQRRRAGCRAVGRR